MTEAPETIFQEHDHPLRMGELLRLGVNRYTLYGLLERGVIERVSRGVYRLASRPAPAHPDLLAVAIRAPQAVVCLVSALAFHDLTAEIPHCVNVAVPRGTHLPRLTHPPLCIRQLSRASYATGIEEHRFDGVVVKVYCPEKTLADCFKFRNKIGMDVFLEALRRYWTRPQRRPSEIQRYARLCRIEKGITPYLEVLG